MNIGQIFEAVLGRAGKTLGVKFATPIFDGATMDDLDQWTDKAGLPRYCKTYLCDGGTGEQFDQAATVGVTYMLKLGHMVEDKMHARSIGPYSLITQQPLGGKAHPVLRMGHWIRHSSIIRKECNSGPTVHCMFQIIGIIRFAR